jgi:hypothetical protein
MARSDSSTLKALQAGLELDIIDLNVVENLLRVIRQKSTLKNYRWGPNGLWLYFENSNKFFVVSPSSLPKIKNASIEKIDMLGPTFRFTFENKRKKHIFHCDAVRSYPL